MALQRTLLTELPYHLLNVNLNNNNNHNSIPTPPNYCSYYYNNNYSSSCSFPLLSRTNHYPQSITTRITNRTVSYGTSTSRTRFIKRLLLVSNATSSNQDTLRDDSDDDIGVDDSKPINDPYLMDDDERREWRAKIRQVIKMNPFVDEELDPDLKSKKMQQLLSQYPLVVEEDDPDWPADADGWGFNLGSFFDKITIKNSPKKDNDDDDDDYDNDNDNEIVWQDDNYIRPIKDITSADWEETVFKDISPLIILVHHRYKRPKENEKIRDELEKAVHIIWNCRLPSPRCVAVDAVVETDLVSALQVSVFPEMIFTKAGKILYREKAIRTADELSKIMAFFYYGAAKSPCLKIVGDSQELIPSVPVSAQP
ncbi:hypothetical protein TIFTF001_005738 [Ficus carica]|uniref:Thioredoxin-like fold domain-containing protein MRL7L, chloroplastic n=1 Tax=Ficus carica TaxID=3494 RepID=A0AA87ZGZ4_FICCA|nr:hypothetical protein TIFTF001_005738 [Ficus carica]